jgi:heparan-alpha-glucosaminide N-acetyltransferase
MTSERLKSIDILRALTMLLMIFVNDLWTLTDIPGWLEHKAANEDGMGLADVVFPAFLFIVGLSIPHAIRARLKKGDSRLRVLRHIMERTLALLIMGVFMVNLEHINVRGMLFGEQLWQILMTLGFFLIWNIYRDRVFGRIPPWVMKGLGWVILIFLAATFKGPAHGSYEWMRFYWWGILGLIGWGYLLGAVLYLVTGNRPGWISLFLILLILLNINEFTTPFPFRLTLIVSASNYACVMCGVLVTATMIRLEEKGRMGILVPLLAGFAALLLIFGFVTRPLWGISKIQATPSWTTICAAITALSYALLHLLADKLKITRWADPIRPAGDSTLTCYLVPYYLYAFAALTGLSLPGALTTGMAGILKSVIFSLLAVQLTGLLGRIRIRLRI